MIRNVFPPLLILVALTFCPLLCSHAAHAQKANIADQFDTGKERIGELRLGLPENELQKLVSCAPNKLKEQYEGATGDYVQTWKYLGCGIVLKMSANKRGGAKKVADITITSPSTLQTSKGVHIGSAEKEVLDAYGRYRDRDGATSKGKRFVAGSIFDGLIFEIKDGKVAGIFLGAAAE
jgi:hypothetical protein